MPHTLTYFPSFRLNYVFFGSYFFIIAAIHLFHVFLIPPIGTPSCYFFAIYSLGQCALETLLLILTASFLRQILPPITYRLFSILFFILLLIHPIDFTLIRIMDMSFWFAIHLVFQESGSNFLELLYASNVSLFIWGAAALASLILFTVGMFLFRWTEKYTDRYPWFTTYPKMVALIGMTALFLMTWERSAKTFTYTKLFERYQKTLPWNMILTSSTHPEHYLNGRLKPPEEEAIALHPLDSRAFSLTKQPDIYLFVIESLREDYIQPHQAPHLHAFKQNHIHFDLALSNANATQDSWFSIFFSQYPFYRGKINSNNWKGGSIPLRLLKTMGYQIHAFSSARLSYYQMDELIFGNGMHLTHSFFTPDEEECSEPYQKDRATMERLIAKMQEPSPPGQMCITFLDATHHDYSWPVDECSPFQPFEKKVNYFKIACGQQGISLIQNRYRNALYFIDTLIGQFLQELNQSQRGKEAIVIIAADHGDEFYEYGHLFHASGLTHPQTHIPLYYKFGTTQLIPTCHMTCHMDIFPSIFHYLLDDDLFTEVLQGQSIFKLNRWPYIITSRFNASRAPYEFSIHNGKEKLIARFSNPWDIFNSKKLKILSIKNNHEEHIHPDSNAVQTIFGEAIDHLFAP